MKDFSTKDDATEAVGVFVAEFAGLKPGGKKVAQAAVNVLSFGTGMVVGGMQPAMMAAAPIDDPKKFCEDVLEKLKSVPMTSTDGMDAATFSWLSDIPWAQLFQVALALLQKYLPNVVPPLPGPIHA